MNTFVRMTVTEGRARFSNNHGNYEVFCCRWDDFRWFMEHLLETDAPTTVKFEMIESEKSFVASVPF